MQHDPNFRAARSGAIVVPQALALKASIPYPRFQSDLLDSDNHGGQQYAPLMDIDIPEFQSGSALLAPR